MKTALKKIAAVASTIKQRRVARRKPSGFDFVLADKIDFMNPAHWDELAAHSIFLSRDYLRVLEQHSPSNVQVRYAMAYADGKPAAITLLQRISVSGDRIPTKSKETKALKKPLAKQLTKPLEKYGEHLLVCGNVLIWGPRSFAVAADIDPAAAWLAIGEAIYRLRRADKLLGESDLIMVKDMLAQDEPAQESLRLLGYRAAQTEPDMQLTIRPTWKKPEDYLASLTSSYRSNVKKLAKDCVSAGVTFRMLDAQQMQQHADEIHALYLQVHEGQPLRLATLDSAYLPALAGALGPRFVCRVAEQDGKLVGFVTTVLDGDCAIGYYIGYDKAANETAPIYLSLLRSCVDDAIELGAKQLSLGRTALEPKAKMGCKPVAISCAVKHRLSAFNPLISAMTHSVSHAEPPERNPFKVAKEEAAG